VRILHVTSDWKWTGPAEPMLNAAAALRERGHQVDLAFPEPPRSPGGLAPRARLVGLDPVLELTRRRGYVPLRDAREIGRLRALVRARDYDIVHAHHTRDHLLAWRALRGQRAALVVSWHHGDPIPSDWRHRLRLGPARAHGLVVLSDALAEAASRELRWPSARVAAVPGCVDAERFQPRPPSEELRKELGLAEGERAVGLVARLQPHRRVELVLEALALARSEAPELRLLVVGRGTRAREVLDEPVERLGLGDAVIRAGYRSSDYLEVLSVLQALVFVVPGSDGSCRAVLEAMAMGIPTLASRRGALPDTVVHGETGLLLDEEPAAFAEALVDVCRRPDVWAARGAAARGRVLERHTPAHAAERLERLYRSRLR
jgi:glycosyltransferase involved in cell wall biosynthesis